jgi:hypothetical protein
VPQWWIVKDKKIMLGNLVLIRKTEVSENPKIFL